MARLRPIGHEDRLSIVEHLDELRVRLVISLVALVAAFALCMWQNDRLLDVVNRPLERTASSTSEGSAQGRLEQTAQFQRLMREALIAQRAALVRLARSPSDLSPADRAALARAARAQQRAIAALPRDPPDRQPVTLGVGEPFVTTVTVAAWAAILLVLPLILYQAYAFVLPAFTAREKRIALPLMAMVPFLFIAGVVFGYFVVLPPAIDFLQNFNDESFDILVQARDYYRFVVLALMAMGVLFQIPVGVLALTRLGAVTPEQLAANRRYAILAIAVLAMLLPGTDPVTMLIAMVPLVLLFEASILLARALGRPPEREDAEDDPAELFPAADDS